MLGYLVATRYTQIDTAFTYEGGDVSGREEDERKRQVFD